MTDSKSRNMSHTYRFDVSVRQDPLLSQGNVCELFKDILRAVNARIKISGLENCAFPYDLPDGSNENMSGYVHVNKASRLTETGVSTWKFDERIIGEIEKIPVMSCRLRDWRQKQPITSFFAACDSGTRRLEDWVGSSLGAVNWGGRPTMASQSAKGEGDATLPRLCLSSISSSTASSAFALFLFRACAFLLPAPDAAVESRAAASDSPWRKPICSVNSSFCTKTCTVFSASAPTMLLGNARTRSVAIVIISRFSRMFFSRSGRA